MDSFSLNEFGTSNSSFFFGDISIKFIQKLSNVESYHHHHYYCLIKHKYLSFFLSSFLFFKFFNFRISEFLISLFYICVLCVCFIKIIFEKHSRTILDILCRILFIRLSSSFGIIFFLFPSEWFLANWFFFSFVCLLLFVCIIFFIVDQQNLEIYRMHKHTNQYGWPYWTEKYFVLKMKKILKWNKNIHL